jgi:hypothetical protein
MEKRFSGKYHMVVSIYIYRIVLPSHPFKHHEASAGPNVLVGGIEFSMLGLLGFLVTGSTDLKSDAGYC